MKKKTATQLYIDKALKEAIENGGGVNISDTTFNIDVDIGDSVIAICEAVQSNARAIEAAAEALKDHKTIGMNFEGAK